MAGKREQYIYAGQIYCGPGSPTLVMRIREEHFASLIASGGLIYASYVGSLHFTSLESLTLPFGPLELCALGVILWLHAKWRRATAINK